MWYVGTEDNKNGYYILHYYGKKQKIAESIYAALVSAAHKTGLTVTNIKLGQTSEEIENPTNTDFMRWIGYV
jgi:hypothetical protein